MFLDRTMEFAADHAERIEAASVESVNEAIRKYIDWDKLVKSIAGDFESKTGRFKVEPRVGSARSSGLVVPGHDASS